MFSFSGIKKWHVVLFLACLLSIHSKSESRDTIFVSEYGCTPNTYENCVVQIQKAINDCKKYKAKVLSFQKGRYDIWPEGAIRKEYFISNTSTEQECPSKIKTIGLMFDGIKDLEIDGNGALLMYHGKMITMALDSCENIKIHSLSTDFERPTASEVEYIKKDDTGVTVSFHPDSRYEIVDGKINLIGEGWKSNLIHCIEWDKNTSFFTYSNGWNILSKAKATEVSPGVVHFKTSNDFSPQLGNILTMRDIIRDQVGMFIKESENVFLKNVNMHYMHGLGIVNQYSSNITMDSVMCMPSRTSGRILAASADMMHFSGCKGKITVQNCRFEGAHDDPINIHGTNLRVISKIDDETLLLRFMHGQSYGFTSFHEGDKIAFVLAATMQRINKEYTVVKAKKISEREIEIVLDKPVPEKLEIGLDCVENITYTPEVVIRNNYFTRTSTRGLLVTTPKKVIIENNIFEKTGMSAILIESDAEGWFESGPVNDVLISNNTFIDCGYQGGPGHAVIALNPSNRIVDSENPVHRNVRIVNNYFKSFDFPLLYAKSTSNIIFDKNKVERTSTTNAVSGNKWTFYLNGCKDVFLRKTEFINENYIPTIKIDNMKKQYVKASRRDYYLEK